MIALGPCLTIYYDIPNFDPYFTQIDSARVYAEYGENWTENYVRLCGMSTTALACSDLKEYRALP